MNYSYLTFHAEERPDDLAAFVRAPEGNGCAERFKRTLKENLLWVSVFQTVEELRLALLEFRETYNTNWLIERHGFMTPTAFRQRQLSISCPNNPGRYRCLLMKLMPPRSVPRTSKVAS